MNQIFLAARFILHDINRDRISFSWTGWFLRFLAECPLPVIFGKCRSEWARISFCYSSRVEKN